MTDNTPDENWCREHPKDASDTIIGLMLAVERLREQVDALRLVATSHEAEIERLKP